MLDILRRLLVTPPDNARLAALETHTKVIYERLEDVERAEATRAAEHAAMVDQLDRLFKRISARMSRADRAVTQGSDSAEESPLALKRRLGR